MQGSIPYETRFNVGDIVYYVRHRDNNSFEECPHCKSRHFTQNKVTEILECKVIGISITINVGSTEFSTSTEIRKRLTLSDRSKKPYFTGTFDVLDEDEDGGLFRDRKSAEEYINA